MEFGVKVKVGNYQILKFSKGLSKKELKVLRDLDNVPLSVRKYLNRAILPFIKVSTISGSWCVEFVAGTTMFEALDALHVVHDKAGNHMLMGNEKKNTEAMFVGMLADTTTVGDYEYMVKKQELLSEYLDRASKKRNEQQDTGKTEGERKAESEAALEEVAERERSVSTLKAMGEELMKEE